MRVIAGQAKGRRLKAPQGMNTRPTSDRVKEAIFNVLAGRMEGADVLDVFAGSGGLGIEALSRGAENAVFIEKNFSAWQAVKENLLSTGLSSNARVLRGEFASVLPQLKDAFDIVFLDPPYNQGYIRPAVSLLISLGLIKQDGIIVIETSSKIKEIPDLAGLKMLKESVYGDTAVLYYLI